MSPELDLDIIYENKLDTGKFSRMFNNKAQSYKFYWFEAILNLTINIEKDLTFEEIIDEMICEAWHTVTHYHLRLGPTINGNAENFLEHAINTLNSSVTWLSQNPSAPASRRSLHNRSPPTAPCGPSRYHSTVSMRFPASERHPAMSAAWRMPCALS